MDIAYGTPVVLDHRRERLLIAGEMTGLVSVVVTGLAIALWPSDPTLSTAFDRLVDIPHELAGYLQQSGVEIDGSVPARFGVARMPVLAYEIYVLLLFFTGAGAALRARWVLFFGVQILLLFPLPQFAMLGYTGVLSKFLFVLAAGRALIGRNLLLAGVIVSVAVGSISGRGFVLDLTTVQGPGKSGIVLFHNTPRNTQVERQDMLVAALSSPPAELNDTAAYVRAQIAYIRSDPATVSAELRTLDPGKFSHGRYSQERLTILAEFAASHSGIFPDTKLAKKLSATIGFLAVLMIITATFLTRLAAALKRRIRQIETLSGKISDARAAAT